MSVSANPATSAPAMPAAMGRALQAQNSHSQILKSTSILGFASVLTILVGVVRTKALALLLGPAGVGLVALFDSVTTIARTIASLGISTSGVREIAEAAGTADERAIGRTVFTLRRMALLLGAAGALGLFLLRKPVCVLTFGNTEQTWAVGLLSVTVLFGTITGGQAALVQGMRRVADLARLNVMGAAWGAVIGIPVLWFWGTGGIPAYLVVVAGLALATSWWYSHKIRIEKVSLSWKETWQHSAGLLRLGSVFLISALLMNAALYIIRICITRAMDVNAVGYYQAASTLSMLYVSFILQAMGTDFLPRLTAAAKDNRLCNRLVNEQTEVSILLAVPGVLGTLLFSDWIIATFYTRDFSIAAEILRWQVLGVLLRVACWPMGFILVAKGAATLFLVTEILASLALVGFTLLGLRTFGLPGTGMAFLALYFFYWTLIQVVVRKISGFSWSRANIKLALISVAAVALLFGAQHLLPKIWALLFGIAITGLVSVNFLKRLISLAGIAPNVAALLRFLPWTQRPLEPS